MKKGEKRKSEARQPGGGRNMKANFATRGPGGLARVSESQMLMELPRPVPP